MSLSCTQAQEKLQALKSLKMDFKLAVAKFAASGKKEDADQATRIKGTFDEAVDELQKELPRPDEFILRNIPKWDKLPSPETLEEDFKLDLSWEQEYRANRLMTDFEVRNNTEASSIAKVFDIGDVIHQKKQEDPEHKGSLSTTEVLEAIDKAGYRPATLEELLAFSRDHWNSGVFVSNLTEKERLQNIHVPYIYGLNSVFSTADGNRSVPYLHWSRSGRLLSACDTGEAWDANGHFLVLRKSSS